MLDSFVKVSLVFVGDTKLTFRRGSKMRIDLDLVFVEPEVIQAWKNEVAPRLVELFIILGVPLESVPLERGKIEEDGTLFVYVSLPTVGRVGMRVPSSQWAWKQAH